MINWVAVLCFAYISGSIYVFDNTGNNSKAVERLNLDDGTWSHITDRGQQSYDITITACQGIGVFGVCGIGVCRVYT